ncbi:TetR/AcrR family transcriptional regulator [Singulisphaera sp. PoT]|uniref:TetR/AcrR family transcriptional regulator n=1 Tax=Singulisphaera sp. PoT TaxID=3411797 RepID=UPI003BF55216
MRKSREEAAQTRKRIVTTAAAEFRKNGVGATGLNDLMKAAGLTHGGFYKHFESKDQLVAEAYAEAMQALVERLREASSEGPVPSRYLSARHRDNPEGGCPLASIGSELGRLDEKTRALATEGFRDLVGLVASQYGKTDAARRRALVTVSTMIGAMTMARVVDDPGLSAEILEEAAKSLVKN